MSFVLLALAGFLSAFGPQVVHARFDSITFSTVNQCGDFKVLFSGGKLPAALPLSLTVVPFNLTPIVIGIADTAWDNTTLQGAAFAFLPFPAGTEFLASLDDANGHSAALVSDVIKVQPSDNTTCLPPSSQPAPRIYTVDQSVSQCEEFHVTYDPSVEANAPTVRAFFPRTFSFPMNQSTTGSMPGNASYTMVAARGLQTVLMLSDDAAHKEATALLSVGGDSLSPSHCLPRPQTSNQMMMNTTESSGQSDQQGATKRTLSKAAIVAIALVCASTIGGLILAMIWFLCRERRRFKQRRQEDIEDAFLIVSNQRGDNRRENNEKTLSQASEHSAPPMTITYFSNSPVSIPRPPPLSLRRSSNPRISAFDRASGYSGYSRRSSGFVKDPLYTNANLDLMEPTSASYNSVLKGQNTSSGPLSQISVPLPSPSPIYASPSRLPNRAILQSQPPLSPTDTLSSDEIEHILDMATMYSGPLSPMASIRSNVNRDSMSSGYVVRSDKGDNATIASVSARRMDTFLRPSPASTPRLSPSPTSLLSPNTARGPPQAPLPSSPLPSPLPSPTGSQFVPSLDASVHDVSHR